MIGLLALLLLITLVPMTSAEAQEAVILAPRATEQGLVITHVAQDLAFPMGMTPLPDGSLLVATSPLSGGQLLRQQR